MTGLTRALAVAGIALAIVAVARAVHHLRHRQPGLPMTGVRVLTWVLIAATAAAMARDIVSGGTAPLGLYLPVVIVVGTNLCLATMLHIGMPARTRRRALAAVLAVPVAIAALSIVLPDAVYAVVTSAPAAAGHSLPGPLFWLATLWTFFVVAAVALLDIASAAQALGPRRTDVVVDGVGLLLLLVLTVGLIVVVDRWGTDSDTIVTLVLCAIGVSRHEHRVDRRLPLYVSRATVLDRIGDAVLVVGPDGTVIDANVLARKKLLVGDDVDGVWRTTWHRPDLDPGLAGALDDDGEHTLTLSSGSIVQVRTTTVVERGTTIARILAARDITQLERLRHELAEQADRDSLTGLGNRRLLSARLATCVAAAELNGTGLCVAAVDVDNLKQVNDQYGHAAGDDALVRVAQVLRLDAAPTDVVCRVGGDEFIIAMPGQTLAGAFARAEHWRTALAALHPPGQPRVTLSVGIAPYRHGSTGTVVVSMADDALYAAKSAGRDRVWGSAAGVPTQPRREEAPR